MKWSLNPTTVFLPFFTTGLKEGVVAANSFALHLEKTGAQLYLWRLELPSAADRHLYKGRIEEHALQWLLTT